MGAGRAGRSGTTAAELAVLDAAAPTTAVNAVANGAGGATEGRGEFATMIGAESGCCATAMEDTGDDTIGEIDKGEGGLDNGRIVLDKELAGAGILLTGKEAIAGLMVLVTGTGEFTTGAVGADAV